MTDFDKTSWADEAFAKQYRDNADIYVVERRRMFGIMKSCYRHFTAGKGATHVLDLGCGDGIVAEQLFSVDSSLSATLIDGSAEMLEKARERLREHNSVRYITASFQEMIENWIINREFDYIVSSMAIHHLTMDEKTALFTLIHNHLRVDGQFMNIDTILPPSDLLEEWYVKIWQEWMDAEKQRLGLEGDPFDDVIMRYKNNNDNKPDTLDDQLDALRTIGFRDVDCYYKYGIFAMYGGKK